MCLVGYQRKRIQVQTDLPVLKIVKKAYDFGGNELPGVYLTPFEKAQVSVPSTVTAKGRYNPMKMEFGGMQRIAVSNGMIHLYREDFDGLQQLQFMTNNNWADDDMVLVRGVIPAGTLFSPGEYGEVCAKTVRYTSLAAYNTKEDKLTICEWCKQLFEDYCKRQYDDPWDPIVDMVASELVLNETNFIDVEEEQPCV